MQQVEKHRPFGVTILAILTIIGGIAFLASGITAGILSPFLSGTGTNSNNILSATGTSIAIPQTLLVGLSAVTGAALLVLGIAYFVMAYGLLKGKGWAWTITVVLSCIGIALGFVSIVTGHVGAVFNVIINGLVLYYIYRPNVKSFFGKNTTARPTASMTR
jgi:uncharacterized membrane protein (DUF2068 family)